MRKLFFFLFIGLLQASIPTGALAQHWLAPAPAAFSRIAADGAAPAAPAASEASTPNLVSFTPLPHMAPELALATYEQRQQRQPQLLSAYSATQIIAADLPDTRQKGEWELERSYVAPKTLAFKPLKFVGDGFVKTNVIARLLKTEVDHVQNDDPAATAVTEQNYKFKYKGMDEIGGRPVHVFEVKPRKKRPGMIKGRIYLDVQTGALRRISGQLAKSPSFFIKKLEFVQDYAEIAGFTFAVHTRSVAKARIVGRAMVDITTRDYAPIAAASANSTATPALQPAALALPGSN